MAGWEARTRSKIRREEGAQDRGFEHVLGWTRAFGPPFRRTPSDIPSLGALARSPIGLPPQLVPKARGCHQR